MRIHMAICDRPILIGLAASPATVVTAVITFLLSKLVRIFGRREEREEDVPVGE